MRTNRVGFTMSLSLTLALSLGACAGTAQRSEAVTAQRLKDSTPERSAALRSATPGLEVEDERWGIEAAKQRKRDRAQQAQAPAAPATFQPATQIEVETQSPQRAP
ncbi:MAG TPA: hypothetical protein VHK47_11700 [Polyangia bacterium]|jgi:hypothetical protein|nr:hypothetical protein [Polyangia bacterium]